MNARNLDITLLIAGIIGWAVTYWLLYPHAVSLKVSAWFVHSAFVAYLLGYLTLNLSALWHATRLVPWFGMALQLVAFFAISFCSPSTVSMILLVMLAGQAPFFMPMRIALAALFVSFITALAINHLYWHEILIDSAVEIGLFFSFALFSLAVSQIAIREAKAREALEVVNAQLSATRAFLAQSARIAERQQLSRDLHDICGHQLTALSLNLELAINHADDTLKPQLIDTKQIAKDLLAQIRSVVRAQRQLTDFDLKPALENMIAHLPSKQIELNYQLNHESIAPQMAQELFYIIQEAISNAIHHGVGPISLSLVETNNNLVLSVTNQCAKKQATGGLGLTSMCARANTLGGILNYQIHNKHWLLTGTFPLKDDL